MVFGGGVEARDQAIVFRCKRWADFSEDCREIAQQRGLAVECRYLYGSRQAWHLPGLEQLDATALQWVFNRQRYLTAEQVLKRVGLGAVISRQSLPRWGFWKPRGPPIFPLSTLGTCKRGCKLRRC